MRAMVDEWQSTNRRLEDGAVQEAEMRVSILAQEAEKLLDGEDRLVWRSIVVPLQTKLAGSARLQTAFDIIAAHWPKDGSIPGGPVTSQVPAFVEKPEHPLTIRFQEWLQPRMEAILAQGDRLIDHGRTLEAVSLFSQLGRAVPLEPWVSKTREGEDRARKAGTPKSTNTEPARPVFDIEFDFVPSDFILTRDGKNLLALNRAKGTVVVVSLDKSEVVREVAVGYEPAALAEVGDRICVCGRASSAIQILDRKTWERAGTVALPSEGPHAIAVASERVFVVTASHLIEIDPRRGEVVKKVAHGSRDPASIEVVPSGERLFVIRNGSVEVWSTKGAFEREGGGSLTSPCVIDGQGQYLLAASGAYDHFLNPRSAWGGNVAAVAVHPSLPQAWLYKWHAITPVDLYRFRAGEDLFLGGGPDGSEVLARARISPDARTIFVGIVQHPYRKADVVKPSRLRGYAIPGKEAAGYFAFTTPPPRSAWIGFPLRHPVLLSEPFAKTAKVTLELAPEGMTLDPATREISWTPGQEHAGRVEIQVRAVDQDLEIRQTILLDVRYRCVLDGSARISNDLRYLYSTNRVLDLKEDRTIAFESDVWPLADRLYWVDSKDGSVRSCAMDGSDQQRHPLEGLTPLTLLPKGVKGPMLALAQGEGRELHVVAVGVKKPARLLTVSDGRNVTISPDGNLIVAQGKLFRFEEGTYREAASLGFTPRYVQFDGTGEYLVLDDGIFEIEGLRLIKKVHGTRVGLDPSGPYFAVPAGRSVEVFRLDTLESVGRFEIQESGWRGGSSPHIGGAVPISSLKLLVLDVSPSTVIVPFKF